MSYFISLAIAILVSANLHAQQSTVSSLPPPETATSKSNHEDPSDEQFRLNVGLIPYTSSTYSTNSPSVNNSDYEDGGTSYFGFHFDVGTSPAMGLRGLVAQLGIDALNNVSVPGREFSNVDQEFNATMSSGYLVVGYQLWRFYGAAGIQHPLRDKTTWNGLDVDPAIGLRLMMGAHLTRHLSVDGFYGTHGYNIRGPFLPTRIIDVEAVGAILKIGV